MPLTLETNIDQLSPDIIDALAAQKESLRSQFHESVMAAVATGKGQPPYSTRPGYFSTRTHRWHAGDRFASFATATGRSPTAAVLHFAQGYAQYKEVVGGKPFKTQPVDAELTGQLLASLVTRVRTNRRMGTITVWTAFLRQTRRGRSGGNMTNRQLVDFFEQRSTTGESLFVPSRDELESIVDEVIRGA